MSDQRNTSVLSGIQVLQKLCGATGQWGMYISISVPDGETPYFDEAVKAASFLDPKRDAQVLFDQQGWTLFPNEEDMQAAFDSCVGDDGPTPSNPYDGPVRVYALTCSPEGELLTENT